MLSHLAVLGRHTITGRLTAAGRQFQDWTAEYRLFSAPRFADEPLFTVARQAVSAALPDPSLLVAGMDDTIVRKRGRKICGVGWKRDPLSPHFRPNFIPGLRYLQISAALPLHLNPRLNKTV